MNRTRAETTGLETTPNPAGGWDLRHTRTRDVLDTYPTLEQAEHAKAFALDHAAWQGKKPLRHTRNRDVLLALALLSRDPTKRAQATQHNNKEKKNWLSSKTDQAIGK